MDITGLTWKMLKFPSFPVLLPLVDPKIIPPEEASLGHPACEVGWHKVGAKQKDFYVKPVCITIVTGPIVKLTLAILLSKTWSNEKISSFLWLPL